jgi:TetR/AcrR family acrAB operon transcriptional repressor
MVRKTKEHAELTRQRIIDAARVAFLARGVSQTSMEQIARQAGVTRGAVYWHFSNKTDLFHAMREQVILPMIDSMDETLLVKNSDDPLDCIERFFCNTIERLDDSLTTRQTYEIMMTKCEYVGEFAEVLQRIMTNCSHVIDKIASVYEHAQAKGQLYPNQDPMQLALDSHLFFIGLLNMWVKDIEGKQFRPRAIALIKSHIALRRR